MLNRRDFIKTTSLAVLGLMFAGCGESTTTTGGKADLVVYGKIFTSDGDKIVEAFAVKDSKSALKMFNGLSVGLPFFFCFFNNEDFGVLFFDVL